MLKLTFEENIGIRYDRPSISRLLPHELPNGNTLVVGRDLQDVQQIEQLVLRALVVGGAIAVLLAIGGAGLIIIIAVPVVPMTVVAPMPVPVRTIIVVIAAIVVRIVATVVYRIRVPIGWSDRYAKVTVSL